MTATVTPLPGVTLDSTTNDVPLAGVMHGAVEAKLAQAVVIGFNQDDQFYFASTTGDTGVITLLLMLANKRVLEHVDSRQKR